MELEIENLSVVLDKKSILNRVSIHIDKNEFVGIIGPNGSGKSTLLKTIYRVLKPSKGSIYINGREIKSLSLKETAREMAVVAQHNEQNFDFTVMDMVLIGRAPHKKFLENDSKKDYELVRDALKKVDMEDFSSRNYNTLSGGEKQRIVLARALAQKTNCLILDEPTNHLDIKHQFQIMKIAKDLGITIVAAIHDLNMAALFCDNIYALDKGKIIGYGSPKNLISEEFIEKLYGVKSKIIYDEDETVNIIYKPF